MRVLVKLRRSRLVYFLNFHLNELAFKGTTYGA